MPWPYKKSTRKTRNNPPLRLETKHTSMGAYIRDVKKKLENLTEAISKVRFRVVEFLRVARHEMSQINTLHALANILDI